MKKYSDKEIKAYAKSVKEETGEACSFKQAKAMLERQAEHDAEAEAGSGEVHSFGVGTGEMTEQATDDAPATVQAETVVTKGKATPGILKVKAGVALRGARAAWYAELQKYDGKPVAEFLAATAEKPPSVPKSGTAEKPSGWLRYFQRTQVASVVAPTESVAA